MCTIKISGWVGLATITGLRVSDVPTEKWPGTMAGANASNHLKFITRYIYVARDIYLYIKTSNNEESSFLKEKELTNEAELMEKD